MNISESEKANIYAMLLNQHSKLHNQINEIKGQNIDMSREQLIEIKKLENTQMDIMRKINLLLSR